MRSERVGEREDGGADFIKQMSHVIAVDRLGFKRTLSNKCHALSLLIDLVSRSTLGMVSARMECTEQNVTLQCRFRI